MSASDQQEAVVTRVRVVNLLCASGWVLFAVQYTVQGRLQTAALDTVTAALLLVAGLLSHRPGPAAQLGIGANVVGLTVASLLSGQSHAMSLWYLAMVPVVAAFVSGWRSTAGWTVVVAVLVGAVAASEAAFHIEPEFVASGAEIVGGQIALVVLVAAAAVAERRTSDRQADALAKARDEALDTARSRDETLASIRHDLRTPLHAVLALADHVASSLGRTEHRRSLDTIHRSASTLLAILDEALEPVEQGAGSIEFVELVEEIVDLHAIGACRRGVELTVRWSNDAPTRLLGDSQALHLLVARMIGEAVQNARSWVDLAVSRGSDLAIVVEVRSDFTLALATTPYAPVAARLRGTVSRTSDGDTSIVTATLGLREATTPPTRTLFGVKVAVLEPRSRTREALVHTLTSWGVVVTDDPANADLVLVAPAWPAAASVAAGATRAAFLVDAGDTSFVAPNNVMVVRTPPRRAELRQHLADAQTRPASSPTTTKTHRVLVVEDDPINREVLLMMLGRHEIEAPWVDDGGAAVDTVATAGPFDLVLMDLRLPTMDGIEATRRIRALSGPQPRIIIVSASVSGPQRSECLDAGADGFLDKPIDPTRLWAVVGGADPAGVPSPDDDDAARVLKGLLVIAGGHEGRAALLEKYLDNTRTTLASLDAAAARGAWTEVGETAHRMRGAGKMYGAPEVSRVARLLEEQITAGTTPSPDEVHALRRAFDTAEVRLHQVLPQR